MAQVKMTLENWLDDLCVRFLINLPRADLSSVARICFQIEEAQWFYEDFIRPLDPTLPSMSLRDFSLKMFQHCPLLSAFSADAHLKAFDQFMQYKTRVPVRGAIMLNEAMDAVVLVRGYKKSASWSFPRGKINMNEDDLDCAVREVYEETGYQLQKAGLVDRNAPVQYLEVTMHDQQVKLYVFRGIPEDAIFETRTRKEIGDIRWFRVSDLPAFRKKKAAGKPEHTSPERFYMVAPFMVPLRKWVMRQKELDAQNAPHPPPVFYDENITDDNTVETTRSAAPGSDPDMINQATEMLQQLLRIKPPTQGLQLPPSVSSNPQAGQTLMSYLQPSMTNPEGAALHTPLEQTQNHQPNQQPPTPHHHQQPHRYPLSEYTAPPQFPVEAQSGTSHNQYHQDAAQHRPRPHVFVAEQAVHAQHAPHHLSTSPRQQTNPPVQLLHPQPLPPQVQQTMLLRDMASPPSTTNPTVQPGARHMMAPAFQAAGQGQGQGVSQQQPLANQGQQGSRNAHQLPAHSANLLNVLKGSNMPPSAQALPSHPSPSHRFPQNMSEGHHHGHHPSLPQAESPHRYDAAGLPPSARLPVTTLNTATMNAPAPFSAMSARRPLPPTDKHRAGLLDMFKRGPSAVSQHQGDGQGASSPRAKLGSPAQQWTDQGLSNAGVFKAAAQENGRPIQMNPETNLPYGAHSILRRGPSQASGQSPAVSTRNSHELPAYAAGRSPESFRNQKSPYYSQASMADQAPKQMTAHAPMHSPSFPYGGGGGQGSRPDVLAQGQGNQGSSSGFVGSGGMKSRQNSTTVEHRNNLLSILGRPPTSGDQGKGKETMMSGEQAGPRSRLASFASNESGRGSTAPISTADRNFLLGFLENASHNSRGRGQ